MTTHYQFDATRRDHGFGVIGSEGQHVGLRKEYEESRGLALQHANVKESQPLISTRNGPLRAEIIQHLSACVRHGRFTAAFHQR